ncbi:TPA: hypothetical protein ACMUAQ_002484 [Enterococcus faecalis]
MYFISSTSAPTFFKNGCLFKNDFILIPLLY